MSEQPVTVVNTIAYASTIQSSVALVTISPDEKNICIDWAEVEKQALGSDPFLHPLARALIAVRDGKYQTVEHSAPEATKP